MLIKVFINEVTLKYINLNLYKDDHYPQRVGCIEGDFYGKFDLLRLHTRS